MVRKRKKRRNLGIQIIPVRCQGNTEEVRLQFRVEATKPRGGM